MTVQIDPEGTESTYLHRFAEFRQGISHVLELGCGDGRLTWRYAGSAGRVTGIDLLADDLRLAVADRPANLIKQVNFARASAASLPFKSRAFDLAIFAWSF